MLLMHAKTTSLQPAPNAGFSKSLTTPRTQTVLAAGIVLAKTPSLQPAPNAGFSKLKPYLLHGIAFLRSTSVPLFWVYLVPVI